MKKIAFLLLVSTYIGASTTTLFPDLPKKANPTLLWSRLHMEMHQNKQNSRQLYLLYNCLSILIICDKSWLSKRQVDYITVALNNFLYSNTFSEAQQDSKLTNFNVGFKEAFTTRDDDSRIALKRYALTWARNRLESDAWKNLTWITQLAGKEKGEEIACPTKEILYESRDKTLCILERFVAADWEAYL